MRTIAFVFLGLLATASLSSPTPVVAAAAAAAPCTKAAAECTEWVTFGGGSAPNNPGGLDNQTYALYQKVTGTEPRSMIYRTHPLDAKNDGIHRALIMVHGTNRNADRYFATATAAAFLAGAQDDTVVIAPHFVSSQQGCMDHLEANEVSWSCGGDSWRSGGTSSSNPDLASFDFIDAILKKLANKAVFPNMRAIVVAGHSAGGQFVTRYEMANKVHDTLGVPVSYVVANPSSYAWPDATRPLADGDATPDAAAKGWSEVKPHTNFTFGPFDPTKGTRPAPSFNKWPFGLESRTTGYTKGISDEQLIKQLVTRPTTYLLSQVDTLPLGGFDSSANAMAQGATRRARGEAFFKYVTEKLGAKHNAIIIEECGHNDRCVYTTDVVFPVIFPK
jgi:pimeloyl-ACP methyl ester carboxylesterase